MQIFEFLKQGLNISLFSIEVIELTVQRVKLIFLHHNRIFVPTMRYYPNPSKHYYYICFVGGQFPFVWLCPPQMLRGRTTAQP